MNDATYATTTIAGSTPTIAEIKAACRKMNALPKPVDSVIACSPFVWGELKARCAGETGFSPYSIAEARFAGMPVSVIPGMVGFRIIPREEWDEKYRCKTTSELVAEFRELIFGEEMPEFVF